MKHLAIPALLAALLAQAPAVQAASAQASIDWSSLTVTVYDLSGGSNAPQLSWSSEYGTASAYAVSYGPYTSDGDSMYQSDWGTLLAVDAVVPKASSDASRSAGLLVAQAAAQTGTHPSSETSGYIANYGSGHAYNSGGFTVTGQGLVMITLAWTLSVQGAQFDYDDYATAYVWIQGSFSDGLFNSGTAQSSYFDQSFVNGDATHHGTFAMSMYSNGIDPINGSLSASAGVGAYAVSQPVPEPETYALMLAGLGLVGWRARRRRA